MKPNRPEVLGCNGIIGVSVVDPNLAIGPKAYIGKIRALLSLLLVA